MNKPITFIIYLLTVIPVTFNPVRADDELPVDPAAESELLKVAGDDGFEIHRTRHFLICYNTDRDKLLDFVARVEGTYLGVLRFLDSSDFPRKPLNVRLEILFFANVDQFSNYAKNVGFDSTGAAGFYSPENNRAAFFDTMSSPRFAELNASVDQMQRQLKAMRGKNRSARKALVKDLNKLRIQRDNYIETINQLVVQHEVAHQVLFNTGVHVRGAMNPMWLVEGLACLFEPPPSSGGAGLGRVNQYRLVNLRRTLSPTGEPADAKREHLQDAFDAKRMFRLMQLVADPRLLSTARADVETTYAQAWSLVFYLQRKHRDKLGEYLRRVAQRPVGKPISAIEEFNLFEDVFGPLDEEFERRWISYLLKQRFSQKAM